MAVLVPLKNFSSNSAFVIAISTCDNLRIMRFTQQFEGIVQSCPSASCDADDARHNS